MANPGAGSKFVSVNLNKSYGQPPSYAANAGRVRNSQHGGGSGGMVVLSRPRSSASGSSKVGSRLSVPPPLNLPSLRKEHERFDQSSAVGGSAGVRNTGSGAGHVSAVGWMKPGLSATLLEKDGSGDHHPSNDNQRVSSPIGGGARGSGSVYMPPAARLGAVGKQQVAAMARDVVTVEKAVVLRGEDFPTLHATLSSGSMSAPKHKEVLNQKQKPSEEVLDEHLVSSDSRSPLYMRPQMRSSRLIVGSSSDENGIPSHVSGGLNAKEQSRKMDRYLPGPLPVVRLRHTSDWEDDERDTGHGFPSRDRDHGFKRNEASREREFDAPRVVLPQTSVHDLSDGRGLRDAEPVKVSSREVLRGDSYGRDVTTPTREVRDESSWRISPLLGKDGFGGREIRIDRNGVGARPFSSSREIGKDNKYSESTYRDSGGNGFRNTANGTQDSRYVRRDSSYGGSGQNRNRVAEAFNSRGAEQNQRSRYDLPNRFKGDVFQSSSVAKTSFSLGAKRFPLNDPILNFGKEKRLFSNSGKPYIEDAFDARDPFSGGLIGDAKIFKRKKDVRKQADFHDPVRESFEAELERVQKMQEQERQRVAEEQARALELARREEEERHRLAREDEERRRRLEEEAKEAAWIVEQERLEAVKRSEEQKMAIEEEKRKIHMEEERRKEAARQKLLELEARIARRQDAPKDDKFATVVGDERMPGILKGRDAPRVENVGDWEDGERMVDRITSSASSDSSNLNKSVETGSRPHSSQDGNSFYMDRGKHSNFWIRDSFENGSSSSFLPQKDHENGYYSRRDGLGAGRVYPRKDLYGGPGVISYRTSTKGGMPGPQMFDDYPHLRGHRWNLGGDGDHYNRNTELDTEFPDNSTDKFGDIGWGHGPPCGSANAPYADRLFQNTDVDGFSSFGRSTRHSMRQPRVLPPPSLPSVNRTSFRTESERSSSSIFFPNEESKCMHNTRRNDHILQAGYETSYQDTIGQHGMMDAAERNIIPNEQKDEKHPPRCDSQSSLSVSSPPDSPTHLSHDDLDDSGDFAVLPVADDGKLIALLDSEHVLSASEGIATVMASSLVSTGEDEKWAIDNDEDLQEQEEYDEEEDTYHEDDEVHEGDDENLDVAQEFEDLNSTEYSSACMIGQVVLGFNEGVEVEMPNGDEFENASKNVEKAIETQAVSVGIATVVLVGNEPGLQAGDGLSEGSRDSSSKVIDETETSLQNLTLQNPVESPSYLADNVEVPSSSSMPDQWAVASATNSSVPSEPVLPAVSSVLSQAEVPPVKLQFGLFSGPSLIPSPVPAIQIGSIQMPLLHPQVGPSITQLHPLQPPFFQFGQLRYTSPMSQGILQLAPQTLTFAQPSVSAHYSLNQNGGCLLNQAGPYSSSQNPHPNEAIPSVCIDNEPDLVPTILNSSQENVSKERNALFVMDSAEGEVLPSDNQADGSLFVENITVSESVSQVEDQGHCVKAVEKNFGYVAGNKDTQGHQHTESTPSQFFSNEKDLGGSKAPGAVSSSKGKRFIYAVRNTGSRSTAPVSEASYVGTSGFQRRDRRNIRRTEFRVRENVDRRQSEGLDSSNYSRVDEKSNFNGRVPGISTKGGNKKDAMLSKSTRPLVESETIRSSSALNLHVDSERKMNKVVGKDAPSKRLISAMRTSRSREGSLQSSVLSEDFDTPLQSGVVRVFKQPGIEAPSDEDDFIEVRSKRQMLNDRREQREKEIKAKSRVIKAPRKPRIPVNLNRTPTSLSGEMVSGVHSESVVSDGWASANDEVSTGFTTGIASPPLPPIGTPAMSTDTITERKSLAMKSVNMSSVPVISSGGTNLVPGIPFENKNAVQDNVVTPFGTWASVCINQQVMALTQTQLDEAMKPARFNTHVPPIDDHTGSALELGKVSTSILTQDKSFSSSTSPLSSLLAGEKIQFGAVTSPTILPPSSIPVSSGIGGPPGSCRSNVSIDHNLSTSEGECTIHFDKEKHPDSCVQLDDPEAEAEAAASAVAVAAISSDELGASSASVSDSKSFGGANISGLPSGCGMVGYHQLPSQSRGKESLTVALPADLSVENPLLSLWPPLPSPHNCSGPMLPHFAGAPPPHFPCYEMNPMLGGPIFAFGPHDESAETQSQSQKSSTVATGSLGAWQPCHSGVDSFYGPAGFTGPFISPGGISGVQGHPHMVVYNHFAPVGQFGQVGLSFMGATYIPSGNQPDWKHTPVSATVGNSEGDIHNLNISSGQRNPSSIPASIQQLAPGSPLFPIASPFAMFDLSPFQSTADVPVQACWPHVPTSPLHSLPPSMPPLRQQVEGGLSSQFSHGLSVETPNAKSFQESRSSTPADSCRGFSPASGSTSLFPGEGLIEPSSATFAHVQTSRPTSYSSVNGNSSAESIVKSSSRGTLSDSSQSGIVGNSSSLSMSSSALMVPTNQQHNSSAPHYLNPIEHTEQRGGGVSHKISSGDWHRRVGFQGRNQTLGPDKNVAPSKMKQIYVAKPATSVPTSTV